MTRAQAVANGQEILWSDSKLSHVLLGREVILQEMTSLRLAKVLKPLLTGANLNGVVAIAVLLLDLDDLAPVYLHNSAGNNLAPLVPEVSHSYLVAKEAHTSGVSVGWGGLA